MHGTADEMVPAEHSRSLHDLLRAAGARSTYRPVQCAGHELGGCGDVERLIADTVGLLGRELGVRPGDVEP